MSAAKKQPLPAILLANDLLDGDVAVSYTHLDVYKRQVRRSINAGSSRLDTVGIALSASARRPPFSLTTRQAS